MSDSSAAPRVTLILAVRNEEAHIARAVGSCLDQDYPADRLEIIVIDGESTDATLDVVRTMDKHGRVRTLNNPERLMPYGLNRGLEAAAGDFIGLVSGHGAIPPDYVWKCVDALERTGAWAVGARIVRRTNGPMHRAVAAVTSHPLGVGDARHNYATSAGWVEAAYPGFWRREVFERVGAFDPAMVVNEDNELSLRIRQAGGGIWYEPSIGVEYVPRDSLGGVFQQYRRYAFGKIAVVRKHRAGISWRHVTLAAWVAWLVGGGALGLISIRLRIAWLFGCTAYLAAVGWVTVAMRREASPWRVGVSLMTIHAAYGIGLVQGASAWLRGLLARER